LAHATPALLINLCTGIRATASDQSLGGNKQPESAWC